MELGDDMTFHGGNWFFASRISAMVSNMSFLWSMVSFEVSLPMRYCCFSSNRNKSDSSGR